jgi:hypothetical protein
MSSLVQFHGIPFSWAQFKALVSTTNEAYPRSVNLGHALFCISAFREWRSVDGVPDTSWIHAIVGSYWCFGNAGSTMCDFFFGHPPNVMTHPEVATYWTYAYLAVYHR